MKWFLAAILSFITITSVWAHQDFWVEEKFDNVYVRFKTGYFYNEMAKVTILGELAQTLCKKLKYTKPVFIDIDHCYVEDCDPVYFISFDQGEIQYTWGNAGPAKPYMEKKGLVVRQVASIIDVEATLKLVEYAINNQPAITQTQQKLRYQEHYCQWEINSIDTLLIKEHLGKAENSKLVCEVLETPVYVNKQDDFKYGFSYFYKDKLSYVFYRDYNKRDTVLLKLPYIYQIKDLGTSAAMVFDTDSSFYFINGFYKTISQRHVIHAVEENFEPFEIVAMGGGKVSIHCSYYTGETGRQPKQRNMVYDIDKDYLLQDLDKVISK